MIARVAEENGMAAKRGRAAILDRLRNEIGDGYAIYDALCGSGITAKMAARGGASMVTTHSLAYFRMQGLSSMAGYLPICDANALTLELGERALVNVVGECPLIAGLLCVDPTRDMRRFLEKVAAAGYGGVMNCPTVALIAAGSAAIWKRPEWASRARSPCWEWHPAWDCSPRHSARRWTKPSPWPRSA
jgi:predicted TIM-barrel enzyme